MEVNTLVFLVVSIAIMFLLRSIWTIPIEVAGDAVRKFYAAAEIVRTGDWTILLENHHTMRWSVVLPQTFFTWFFGNRYEVYYMLPLLSFALYFVVILYGLKDHLNTSQKILLGILLFADPMSFRNSSQLMTAGPAIFYAISACYVLSAYAKKSNIAMVVAAILFFCAYGAQATYVSFAAGGLFWLAFVQRSWVSALVLAGTLAGLLIAESLFFNYLSGWELKFGRVEALFFGPHLKLEKFTATFPQLFTRWLQLPVLDIALSTMFFIAGLVYVSLKKKPVLPGFITCVYLVGLCFALFTSFALVKISPVTPVQLLLPRYLSPFLPFAAIISVYFLMAISKSNRKTWDAAMLISAALLATIVLTNPQVFDHSKYPKIKIRSEGFIWKSEDEYTAFSKQIHEGNLLYTGRKPFVVKMITQFKYPVGKQIMTPEASATNQSIQPKCVRYLKRIPSKKNYRDCKPEELEKFRRTSG